LFPWSEQQAENAQKHPQARTSTLLPTSHQPIFAGKKIPHGFDSLGRSIAMTEKSHRVHNAAEKKTKGRNNLAEKSCIYKRI
jgi:hypothetical protein